MTRVSLLHTGAVVIGTFQELAARHLPGVEIHNLLDDRIVADLGADRGDVSARLRDLVDAAKAAGSDAVMLTCSSISGYAAELSEHSGIEVLRVDEAMADEAVRIGARVAVVATLETTLAPTVALLEERAALAGKQIEVRRALVDGAFQAAVAGDRGTHDRLVADAIRSVADDADVVVLAQASMASAASTVEVAPPVLTSPELGVKRLAARLE